MNEELTQKQIDEIIKHLKNKESDINIYITLMKNKDIDDEYRKDYINYYAMNQSRNLNNENYFNGYFKCLEQLKENKEVEFEDVLKALIYCEDIKINYISPSYASKLLATINPNKPVWDNNVLIQLDEGLDKEYKRAQRRYNRSKKTEEDLNNYINKLVDIYRDLEKIITKKYLNSKLGNTLIEIFNTTFNSPEFNKITNIKKIDLVLWSLGNKKFIDDKIKK